MGGVRVEVVTDWEGCQVKVPYTQGRAFRATTVTEVSRVSGEYSVTLSGPIVTYVGRDHSTQSGSREYVPGADGELRSVVLGEPFPAELEHLLRGEKALEVLGWPAAAAAGRPRVVVLCGSTRHKSAFEAVARELTLMGQLVISVGVFGHADGIPLSVAQKAALDELHLRKIDMADEVFVVNPDGRIGESTRAEIAYATASGKSIQYYVEPDEFVVGAAGEVDR